MWLPDGKELYVEAAPLLPSEPQTNQRAELQGLVAALRVAKLVALGGALPHAGVDVYSDSEYALKCASTWGRAWRARGWTRPDKKPLHHLDLVQPLVEAVEAAERDALISLRMHHVRGHQAAGVSALADGNNRADVLATGALR